MDSESEMIQLSINILPNKKNHIISWMSLSKELRTKPIQIAIKCLIMVNPELHYYNWNFKFKYQNWKTNIE